MGFDPSTLPLYKDILPVPGMPHGTAWGLFDCPETKKKDNLGTLNNLTPSVVLQASKEIKIGKSIALNWGLEKLYCPGFGRKALEHKILDWGEGKGEVYFFDDVVSVNTQAGSQWDGLRHWGHTKTGMHYNGIHHKDLLAGSELGIENITKAGGIVGRGVLLDYVSHSRRHSKTYSPMFAHSIPLATLLLIAQEQSLTFQPGDILIVRTGWTKWYDSATEEERMDKVTKGKEWIGVEGSKEFVEWLWDGRFSAVAGDSIGWEVWPPVDDNYRLHDHLLSMFGMPIGELWDLEALAEECEKQQRWSFFLTSSPLNITGGVASPPNAIAVF